MNWIMAGKAGPLVRIFFNKYNQKKQESGMKVKGADLYMSDEGQDISIKLVIHGIDSKNTVELISNRIWSVLGEVEPNLVVEGIHYSVNL